MLGSSQATIENIQQTPEQAKDYVINELYPSYHDVEGIIDLELLPFDW